MGGSKKKKTTWKGRRVTVLGAGRSGVAAAKLLVKAGANVFLSESQPPKITLPEGVHAEFGGHTPQALRARLIVPSPGIPDHSPILIQARKKKIPILSELELAYRFIPSRKIVAITGTNGKTTTTSLVEFLVRGAFPNTVVGGNIGVPLSELTAKIKAETRVILEVSSYQLEYTHRFHPQVSVILNITPDHLDHHGSMKRYADAKARIVANQKKSDVCVANADDPKVVSIARRGKATPFYFSLNKELSEGIWYRDGVVFLNWGAWRGEWTLGWVLPGLHNVQNALAAIAASLSMGVPLKTIQERLRDFKGVEHRLEIVRTRNGVRFVNDSKATNVDSTRVALESFSEPLYLIMGGRGKGTPYAPLLPLLEAHTQRVFLIGEEAARIQHELGAKVPMEVSETMSEAVARAAEVAPSGSVVLLSPACASFDQYGNYEERGAHFKQCVRDLP